MTQAPDAHVPHEQCWGSRFCCDLCCGLCCGQMDNLSSWDLAQLVSTGQVSALDWRRGRSMVLHKQGPGAHHSLVQSPPDTVTSSFPPLP